MKKLLAIILILAMLLPSAVLAADPDQIVGYWYFYLDGNKYPELMKNLGDYDSLIDMYYFAEDGTVMVLENAMKDTSGTPKFTSQGKWEKILFGYNFSIIGLGDGKVTVKDDSMELTLPNYNGLKMRLRKIIQFDPYSDYFY